jgi:hypothetical protein
MSAAFSASLRAAGSLRRSSGRVDQLDLGAASQPLADLEPGRADRTIHEYLHASLRRARYGRRLLM